MLNSYSTNYNIECRSPTEAETVAANECCLVKKMLSEIVYPQDTVTIHEDNTGCISASLDNVNHNRTKHMSDRNAYLQESATRTSKSACTKGTWS